ncbi:hypothetical protein RYH80_17870 [Halobaculum sp. MBLA0147]|uniref:hypothetical protein n=1 Tax=Halobaculum sp. MBLA0147 TaxID=3079934 RepID=UPI003523EDEF
MSRQATAPPEVGAREAPPTESEAVFTPDFDTDIKFAYQDILGTVAAKDGAFWGRPDHPVGDSFYVAVEGYTRDDDADTIKGVITVPDDHTPKEPWKTLSPQGRAESLFNVVRKQIATGSLGAPATFVPSGEVQFAALTPSSEAVSTTETVYRHATGETLPVVGDAAVRHPRAWHIQAPDSGESLITLATRQTRALLHAARKLKTDANYQQMGVKSVQSVFRPTTE